MNSRDSSASKMTTKAMLWVTRTVAGRSAKLWPTKCWKKAGWKRLACAVERAILVERRIEQQVGVGQGLAVDPLKQRDAAEREDAGDDVEALDRLVIDEEQRENGDVDGDEELPQEVDLRAKARIASISVASWIMTAPPRAYLSALPRAARDASQLCTARPHCSPTL